MDNYKIRISGRKALSGSITVSGAKNASLPELAATILSDSEILLNGIPNVEDVDTMFNALESIGASGNFFQNKVKINFSEIKELDMNPVLVMEKGKGCKILDVRIGL